MGWGKEIPGGESMQENEWLTRSIRPSVRSRKGRLPSSIISGERIEKEVLDLVLRAHMGVGSTLKGCVC